MKNKILSKYKNVHDHLIQCGFEYDYDHHKGYTYQLNDIIIHTSIDGKINEADNEIIFIGIKH